jgi:hypothetical protein
MKELILIQTELNAPKSLFNKFGNYHYRSAETILEALKPLLKKYNCILTISDAIELIGDRYYIKATASIKTIDGTTTEVTAFAREEETKKGMDGSQITGAASSYARKYALNGLFCIDDTKDADHPTEATTETKTISKTKLTANTLAAMLKYIADGKADEVKKKLANYEMTDDQSIEIMSAIQKVNA